MSDKSFGDHANRNIVKNPLLSTAVTGLSIEDLTHNAVLVPVAPNQGQITGSDQSGTQTQTLANTDNELTNFPSGDSNSSIPLPPQPSISIHSYTLDRHMTHQHDVKPELTTSTVSKASAKSEDDFDVNEYFARLQGTRYVSAPIHSQPDPNVTLAAAEENLEEINLNDDKTVEVQQSLTADIAQNFSQLPNVLPHVASAVFSSFSNMWNTKSREQTPDDRSQSYQDLQYRSQESNQFQASQSFQSSQGPQSFQEVHFQSQHLGSQFHESQGLGNVASVPLMSTEDVVKEVAPPPKEPPISGTSNFRLPSKKKYAQIPGLSTGESKPIAFNPITQNVPSYFIPPSVPLGENKDTTPSEPLKESLPPKQQNINENYNIFSPIDTDVTVPNESKPFIPTEAPPMLVQETPLPPINLQNQVPVIPPPPMFSSTRRDSQSGKSVLPPSVARRIGSNHPVIKQQTVSHPAVTGNIFVPTFDSTSAPTMMDPNIPPISSISQPSANSQMFPPSKSQPMQDTQPTLPPSAPPQIPPFSSLPGPPKTNLAPSSQSAFLSLSGPEPVQKDLSLPPTAPSIFNPLQSTTPAIFTPGVPDGSSSVSSQGPPSLPPSSNIFSPPISQTTLPPGPTQPNTGTTAKIGPTLFTPSASNIPSPSPPIGLSPANQVPLIKPPLTSTEKSIYAPVLPNTAPPMQPPILQEASEPLKPMMEPPKALGASNFRMTKKRPQYYSGPIEGIGSISNSIKPVIPTVDSGTFQGALFTPDHSQSETNVSSFDITKPNDPATNYYPSYDNPQGATIDLNSTSYSGQQAAYPSFDMTQPAQDYSQQYNTAFDLSRPTTESYEHKEEPKESKGFGIIGSLKSKLSSIDINKIQSSVTTFFDPAYNDTKKEPTSHENEPYAQYQGNTQSNFEIFVPNVEQSQPYSYNYNYGQSFEGRNPENESVYQNTPYVDGNQLHQSYATNPYSYQPPSQYQTSNIYVQPKTAEAQSVHEPEKPVDAMPNPNNEDRKNNEIKPTNIPETVQQVSTRELDHTANSENNISLPAHIEPKQEESLPNFVFETQHTTQGKTETTAATKHDDLKNKVPSYEHQQNINSSKSFQETKAPKTLFEMTSNYGSSFGMSQKPVFEETPPIATASNSNKPDDISRLPREPSCPFMVPAYNKEKEVQPVDTIKNAQHDNIKKAEMPKNELLESLSKGEVPILGVSSVPLFGLSTIPVDPSKDDKITVPLYDKSQTIDTLDRNASLSFFENFGNMPRDVSNNLAGSSAGFSLLERDTAQDDPVPSVSFFSNDQQLEKCDTNNDIDLALGCENFGLNEDVVLDKNEMPGYKLGFEGFGLSDNVELDREENDIQEEIDNVSELNICETCREVNKPEEREMEREDLTTQLIENITSPIQLANAVEVPLTEDGNAQRVDFDAGQFEEISHITEETIETLHVQSATELLEDDVIKIANYGWSIDESFVTNPAKHGDFNYTVDPNSISFFGDSLFRDNVPTSDELKAEYKLQEDLLPRQINIASAPPAEEDSKSDETGVLDVHSIELDAKEDFPIYEEFVIEPENDDDNIECDDKENTEECDLDSFTNRVEKFKKMEEVGVDEDPTMAKYFDLPGQPISMASYFDTGNYAADTHYRNTISSPSNISIPPGFEEEFKKRLAIAKAREGIKTVPDTQTQTKTTISLSFSTANTFNTTQSVMPVGFNIKENVTELVEDNTNMLLQSSYIFPSERKESEAPSDFGNVSTITEDKIEELPQSSSMFASASVPEGLPDIRKAANVVDDIIEKLPQTSLIFATGDSNILEAPTHFGTTSKNTEKLPEFSTVFASRAPVMPEESSIADIGPQEPKPDTKLEKMPEASSMFTFGDTDKPGPSLTAGITIAPVEKKPVPPTLPDPINFFADTSTAAPAENFSRLASYFSSPPKTDHAKSFFELSQSQNHYRHVIDQDKYYDLMKDLTSIQNLAVPTDQTIRHVNYFTVEYDAITPEFNNGDSTKEIDTDDRDLDTLSNCRFCTNLIYDKSFKVKTAMNDNTEGRNTVTNLENSNGGNRHSMSSILNFDGIQTSEEANEGVAGMTENRSSPEYTPVKHHWFYRVDIEEKSIWRGFSVTDSRALENAFLSSELNENTLVATDGGRYDVNVVGRLRIPVYWSDKPTNVRRCSWFYKGTTDPRYVPYTEVVADKLEWEYHHGVTTGEWHRRLALPNGEAVVMHGPNVMVHFVSDGFTTPPLFSFGKRVYRNPPKIRVSRDQPERIDHLIFMVHGAGEYRIQKEKMESIKSSSRPRVVRRGHDESEIEDPEPSSIDHLLLLCHGVGSACDMRFRSVEEVVEDFRSTSLQLVQSHYKNSYDQGIVSRVEVLPISWHATLHSGETGVDRRLAQITLDSIPRLRSFTNETVLDVLFYTSPVFCQTILDTVCKELNRIYKLFVDRNPSFKGGVSLGGHSLGSVILYDLLCHQTPVVKHGESREPEKNYVNGPAGTGQPYVRYPSLEFEPSALYALGSPIAIFECIRGVESLGVDFSLPTCKNFFNIFHPYDPIAYRIEPLINPLLRDLKPYLIPHHKGRKRMHLELKDTMARVGADLKQKLLESLRTTWNKWKAQPSDAALERVVEEEIEREPLSDELKEDSAKERELSTPTQLGRLNAGRRVDYVLQEAPLEMINEYLFAMSSHVGYWESEDTMLLMLREIYSGLGIQPDCTVPQQSMSVQRTRISDTKILVNADYPSTSGNAR